MALQQKPTTSNSNVPSNDSASVPNPTEGGKRKKGPGKRSKAKWNKDRARARLLELQSLGSVAGFPRPFGNNVTRKRSRSPENKSAEPASGPPKRSRFGAPNLNFLHMSSDKIASFSPGDAKAEKEEQSRGRKDRTKRNKGKPDDGPSDKPLPKDGDIIDFVMDEVDGEDDADATPDQSHDNLNQTKQDLAYVLPRFYILSSELIVEIRKGTIVDGTEMYLLATALIKQLGQIDSDVAQQLRQALVGAGLDLNQLPEDPSLGIACLPALTKLESWLGTAISLAGTDSRKDATPRFESWQQTLDDELELFVKPYDDWLDKLGKALEEHEAAFLEQLASVLGSSGVYENRDSELQDAFTNVESVAHQCLISLKEVRTYCSERLEWFNDSMAWAISACAQEIAMSLWAKCKLELQAHFNTEKQRIIESAQALKVSYLKLWLTVKVQKELGNKQQEFVDHWSGLQHAFLQLTPFDLLKPEDQVKLGWGGSLKRHNLLRSGKAMSSLIGSSAANPTPTTSSSANPTTGEASMVARPVAANVPVRAGSTSQMAPATDNSKDGGQAKAKEPEKSKTSASLRDEDNDVLMDFTAEEYAKMPPAWDPNNKAPKDLEGADQVALPKGDDDDLIF